MFMRIFEKSVIPWLVTVSFVQKEQCELYLGPYKHFEGSISLQKDISQLYFNNILKFS